MARPPPEAQRYCWRAQSLTRVLPQSLGSSQQRIENGRPAVGPAHAMGVVHVVAGVAALGARTLACAACHHRNAPHG
jgi:hypothetical protein